MCSQRYWPFARVLNWSSTGMPTGALGSTIVTHNLELFGSGDSV